MADMRALTALGTMLLCSSGLAQAADATAPVVGFVHKISGEWEDTVHSVRLTVGSDVRQSASIVRKDPAQSNTHIEIYLTNGNVITRECDKGACANPIVIQVPERPQPRDYIQLLKDLLFGPPDQEVPAATFVYRVTTPASQQLACERRPNDSDGGQAACSTGGSAAISKSFIAPRTAIAGAMTQDGIIDVWGIERLREQDGRAPGAAAGGVLSGRFGGAHRGAAVGAVLSAAISDSRESISMDTYKIASSSSDSEPTSTARFCQDEQRRWFVCSSTATSPGIYVNEQTQVYLFASQNARECMSLAFDVSGTLNKWIIRTHDAETSRLSTLKTSFFDKRARECGAFRTVDRADIVPMAPRTP